MCCRGKSWFSVCPKTPVQVFSHVHQVVYSRNLSYDMPMEQKEEESSHSIGTVEIIEKVTAGRCYIEWRRMMHPCWDFQCPLEKCCDSVFEHLSHSRHFERFGVLLGNFGLLGNFSKNEEGFSHTNSKCCTLLMTYSVTVYRETLSVLPHRVFPPFMGSGVHYIVKRICIRKRFCDYPCHWNMNRNNGCHLQTKAFESQYATFKLSVPYSRIKEILCWEADPCCVSRLYPWVTRQERSCSPSGLMCMRSKLL